MDGQPLSDVITLTSLVPLMAAGCNTLRSAIDKAGDSSACSATVMLLSSASNTLLENRAMHTASLKHLLDSLSQLVSICLCHTSFLLCRIS